MPVFIPSWWIELYVFLAEVLPFVLGFFVWMGGLWVCLYGWDKIQKWHNRRNQGGTHVRMDG